MTTYRTTSNCRFSTSICFSRIFYSRRIVCMFYLTFSRICFNFSTNCATFLCYFFTSVWFWTSLNCRSIPFVLMWWCWTTWWRRATCTTWWWRTTCTTWWCWTWARTWWAWTRTTLSWILIRAWAWSTLSCRSFCFYCIYSYFLLCY